MYDDIRYEFVPASEQIKKYVVSKIEEISMMLADIQYHLYTRRNPRDVVSRFKSEVLCFYGYLAPKIDDFLKNGRSKTGEDEINDYNNILAVQQSGEIFMMKIKKLRFAQAVDLFMWLNHFCELYGITSTKTMKKVGI